MGNNDRDKETGNMENGRTKMCRHHNRDKVTGAREIGNMHHRHSNLGMKNTVGRMSCRKSSNGFHQFDGLVVLMATVTPNHNMVVNPFLNLLDNLVLVARNNLVRLRSVYVMIMLPKKPPVPMMITSLPIMMMMMLLIKLQGVGHLAHLDLVLRDMIGMPCPD